MLYDPVGLLSFHCLGWFKEEEVMEEILYTTRSSKCNETFREEEENVEEEG